MQSAISAHGEEKTYKLLENDHIRSIYESSVNHHGGTHVDTNDVFLNWDLSQKELKVVQMSAESSNASDKIKCALINRALRTSFNLLILQT